MNKRIPIIIGIVMMLIAGWMLVTTYKPVRTLIDRLENLGYDVQLRSRVFTEKSKSKSPVAIIDIDDKSIKVEGRWPWHRSTLARLVTALQEQGAAVIVFDIFFSEKTPNIAENVVNILQKNNSMNGTVVAHLKTHSALFDEDSMLVKSMQTVPSILAYSFLPRDEMQNILPPPLFKLDKQDQEELNLLKALGFISSIPIVQNAAKGGGFINIFPDEDGIVRRAPLVMEYKDGVYPGLALQAVLTFLEQSATLFTPLYHSKKRLEGIQIGEDIIPTDAKGFALIPFIGKSYTFPYYSAIDALEKKVPHDALAGKIVLIGSSATGLGDLQPTSIQNPYPGVEIQASLIEGIMQNSFSHKPAWTIGANLFFTILFGLASALAFPFLGPRVLGVVIVLFPLSVMYINNLIWERSGLVLSALMPILLVLVNAVFNIIYGYLFETRRREQLKAMFGQYVPDKHINEMLKSKDSFGLHGENREMSVMFADIRNFTAISEQLNAAELVDMLNLYFTPMTEIILKYIGTIDKYVGDLIMAFWGAPLTDSEHAYHAIKSALEMQAQLDQLRRMQSTKKWPSILMGIGINSGKMNVGDMGSKFRRNYTVLGDSVNLASRIESLTKFYDVTILVTEFTKQGQTKFIFRKLDRVQVKGRKTGVDIYEVLGLQSQITPRLTKELEVYNKAIDAYFEQRFEEAYNLIKQLHQEFPNTKIYSIYLERLEEFKKNPPPDDWDGVYIHKEK